MCCCRSTFLGSRALAGTLIKHNQLAARGADGLSFEELLRSSGGVRNPVEAVKALALKPESVRHYVEFHIEQGPQLEAAGLALGVVSGIAGQTWLTVAVEGVQNHGGERTAACVCMSACAFRAAQTGRRERGERQRQRQIGRERERERKRKGEEQRDVEGQRKRQQQVYARPSQLTAQALTS